MNYKKKILNSYGFTLAEAMVVMFIICIVAVFATPALTKYSKKLGASTSHGMYACYYVGSTLKQRYAGGDEITAPGGVCTFKLRKSNAYYLIKAVGGGNGSFPGQYVSEYLPKSESELIIKGGNTGKDMVIESKNGVVTALGANTSVTSNLYADNVKSCTLLNAPTSCSKGEQSNCVKTFHPENKKPAIKITVCDVERYELIQTGSFTKVNMTDKKGNTMHGVYSNGSQRIMFSFYDSSFPDATSGAISGMMKELNRIDVNDQNTPKVLRTLKQSGAGNKSKPGAVLIRW